MMTTTTAMMIQEIVIVLLYGQVLGKVQSFYTYSSGSGAPGAVLTSGGGLLLSREGRDLKINFHLNGTNFNFKVNFTSVDGGEEEESEKHFARLNAGDFCLVQVKTFH